MSRGRPHRTRALDATIHVHVTRATREALELRAASAGVDLSTIVRQMLGAGLLLPET